MSLMTTGMLSVLIAGILSGLFFGRVKKLQWVVLFAASLFLVYVAASLYGKWGLTDTIKVGALSVGFQNGYIGWLFFAFSSAVSLIISIFSLSYNDKKHITGIAPLWTILLAANAGIFFATDWIAFLVAWELMGWTSFFIISHGKEKSFQAGIYYFALSLIGTATLLAAVFLIQGATDTFSIAGSMKGLLGLWSTKPGLLYLIAILLTVTFFAKSAAGPFYMWPAKAHAEAPDDFSAFLSGIMIKYGIFGLILAVTPMFAQAGTAAAAGTAGYVGTLVHGTPLYLYLLGWVAAFTAVWATILAIRENDM